MGPHAARRRWRWRGRLLKLGAWSEDRSRAGTQAARARKSGEEQAPASGRRGFLVWRFFAIDQQGERSGRKNRERPVPGVRVIKGGNLRKIISEHRADWLAGAPVSPSLSQALHTLCRRRQDLWKPHPQCRELSQTAARPVTIDLSNLMRSRDDRTSSAAVSNGSLSNLSNLVGRIRRDFRPIALQLALFRMAGGAFATSRHRSLCSPEASSTTVPCALPSRPSSPRRSSLRRAALAIIVPQTTRRRLSVDSYRSTRAVAGRLVAAAAVVRPPAIRSCTGHQHAAIVTGVARASSRLVRPDGGASTSQHCTSQRWEVYMESFS